MGALAGRSTRGGFATYGGPSAACAGERVPLGSHDAGSHLGLGPDVMMRRNPRLIYGTMTGWGQTGPLAHAAAHDINYIAITGALEAMGRAGEPAQVPLNLVGDFGGGSMLFAFGIAAALWERERSRKGQIIDASIVDGAASLMTFFTGLVPSGSISLERGKNLLGGAAPFSRCYLCADGREVAIGAIEPKFYAELLERIGADRAFMADQNDPATWAERGEQLAAIFVTKTRDEWSALLEGSDVCLARCSLCRSRSSTPTFGIAKSTWSVTAITLPSRLLDSREHRGR